MTHKDQPHRFEQLTGRQSGTCGLCGSTIRGGICRA